MVHLTSGQDAVARAVAEAEGGYLPREATIVVGQPCIADPTRAPKDASSLWIQLQELPRRIKGDAAGEIEPPPDGAWNASVAEFYADRIMQRIEREAPGLGNRVIGRVVLSPNDLERLNPNLVGGDPYCGDCSIQQFGPWRPLSRPSGHRTAIPRLWHIGASTHPGPGLGGGSGYLTAKALG
jgi:phytoene dehydrogenase-like protein